MAHFPPMTTLDKIIERYRINDNNDGLGSLGWDNKLFYTKNSTVPILLSRVSDEFRMTDTKEVYELDNEHWATPGGTLDQYYPQPYFDNKVIRGFRIVRPVPNFHKDTVYLVQSGMEDNDYISSGVYQCIFLVKNCLDFPEFFEPVYN